MPERADFSPSEQTKPGHSFQERRAINRISRLGLLLPSGRFQGENKKKTTEVDGKRTPYDTILDLTVALPREGDGVVRRTRIEIERDPYDLHRIVGLNAYSHVADDTADYYGVQPKHQQFSLENYDNELSIHQVADDMKLAVRAVRRYQSTLRAATPAYP